MTMLRMNCYSYSVFVKFEESALFASSIKLPGFTTAVGFIGEQEEFTAADCLSVDSMKKDRLI